MPRAAPMLSAFNAGELTPNMEGRVEVAKYANGAKKLENYIPLIQGPAKRRGGTRFVAEVKDSTSQTWLVRFEKNIIAAYQMEFGNQYIRFYTNHGQLQVSGVVAYNGATAYNIGDLASNGGINYYCIAATTGNAPPNVTYWYALTGTIYEIPSPYKTSDMVNSDGTFNLRFTESNDVVYICHPSYATRKLSRFGATNWQLPILQQTNGPFKTINTTATTVYASAQTGSITVTASVNIFQASHVGALFYIGQKSILDVKQWEAGKVIAIGDLRRSSGVNYKALNAATTGGNKPIHTSGSAYDGDTGVQWTYQDPGYGYGIITAYTSPTIVTMTVINQIPTNAYLIAQASTNWAFGSWSDVEGYPSQVTFYKERLTFGVNQSVWQSVSGDYENFASKDLSGNVTAAQAISLILQSDKVNNMQWFASADSLQVGTASGEFAIQPVTTNLPYGPDNVTAPSISVYGSRNIVPVRVGEAVLFVQRSGLKMRDIIYDFISNKYNSTDQNTMADHITLGGLIGSVYQQEPYSVIWNIRADGQLVSMTYSREQYDNPPYGGWHRHVIGGSYNSGLAIVESVSVIPAPAGDKDELWMIVKRTINGVIKRYIEYMEYERRINDDPEDAFYIDCGATLNNTIAATLTPDPGAVTQYATNINFTAGSAVFSPTDVGRFIHYRYYTFDVDGYTKIWKTAKAQITAYTSSTVVFCKVQAAFPSVAMIAASGWRMTTTTVSGLGYLEGQTVAILGDGAKITPQVVTGGVITLPSPCSKAQIGLACPAKLQTMRLNAGAADGTSQGKTARINQLAVRFHESLGMKFGPDFNNLEDIEFRVVADNMDGPPSLFTGDKIVDFPGDYTTDPWMCFQVDDPFPSTIVSIMPIVSTYSPS